MYPSATKFEGEIVAMVLDLLHGDANACGVVTSGGSESLITALYTYREAARERGVTKPNVVMPITAHVALDKGAYWMDIEVRHAPLTEAYTADVAAMADLIDDQTIALVGSAGDYAHGLIDPIEEIAALAQERGIGMHVDGCLGRIPVALGRGARLRHPAVGLPRPGRDVDLGRHPQVRVRAQGHLDAVLPEQGSAPPPVLHLPRLAGWAVSVPGTRGFALRWA
jgi:sphinganine-1-phosphate aldolase